jgi:ABC-type bacteriocin/lantibiotic exporter with double-glycine peptidase domain
MFETLRKLYLLIGQEKKKLPGIIILFFALSILDVVGIGIIGQFITYITQGEFSDNLTQEYLNTFIPLNVNKENLLLYLGIALVLLYLIKSIFYYLISKIIIVFSKRQRRIKQIELMSSYQSMDFLLFTNRNQSEYIYAISKLTGSYANLVFLTLKTISDMIILLLIVLFLAFLNFSLFLTLIVLILLSVLIFNALFSKKLNEIGKISNQYMKKLISIVNESMGGFKEIRVLGKESFFLDKVEKSARKVEVVTAKGQLIGLLPKILSEMLLVTSLLTIILLATFLDLGSKETIFLLGVYGVASIKILPMTNALNSTIASLREATNSIDILSTDLFKTKKESTIYSEASDFKSFETLEIKNLSYVYPNSSEKILENLFLKIDNKNVIGIIGESGSGKTTLVNIILGLLKPTEGEILINGKKIIRNKNFYTGYMSQDSFYIDGTLLENITLDDKINIEENNENLHRVIKSSRLEKLVKESNYGVRLHIGEHGSKISGGQRQRLSLARLFYFNKELLILDEPTSAMDDKTELEIIKELKIMKNNKTMIIVSHNKRILELCEIVYKIEEKKLKKINLDSFL